MSSIEKHISIIIVSFNVKQYLLKCINSIRNADTGITETEIIVIDNNSDDGSAEAVREHFPEVKLISNDKNQGFSAANNQGMEIASGNFIFLLNPDTHVNPNTVDILCEKLLEDPDCSIIAPKLINTDGTLQKSMFRYPGISDLLKELFFMHYIFGNKGYSNSHYEQVSNPDAVSGAAMMFRKNLIDKIGGLDENMFWMEDTDLCYRAGNLGYVTYCPDISVIHHVGQSQKKNYNRAISNQLMSKLKFFRKHGPLFTWIVGLILMPAIICSRILFFMLLAPAGLTYRKKLMAYLYAMKCYFGYLFLNRQNPC